MNTERIKYLYLRYITNVGNPEELEELERYLSDKSYQSLFHDLLDLTWTTLPDAELVDISSEKAESLRQRVIAERQPKQLWHLRWLRVAAAVAVLVSATGLWFYTAEKRNPIAPESTTISSIPDALPGGNKAILTLAGGRTIDLDTEHDGIKVGNEITYLDGSTVSAIGHDNEERHKPDASNLLSLSTPKGGQYQILLPDGTKVWLNAASSLTYPAEFAENERIVEIEGEAFFEVSKQQGKPFIVKSNGQRVLVLGTSFNISAYPDDASIKTTLVSGVVNVRSAKSGSPDEQWVHAPSLVLRPGQQAEVVPETADIRLSEVDLLETTAWKEGLFVFNNESISSMMKRLARWYDVEVVYQGNLDNIRFLGNYSRNKSLQGLLKNIEQTGKVRFETTMDNIGRERRIMVIAR